MALPNVNINLATGGLGQSNNVGDGEMALLVLGIEAPSGMTIGEVRRIRSLAEAVALGLTPAYEAGEGVVSYSEIKLFYSQAVVGTPLWVGIFDELINVYNSDTWNNLFAIDTPIGVIGVSCNVATGAQAGGIDSRLPALISGIHAQLESRAAAFKPCHALVGIGYGETLLTQSSQAPNLKTMSKNRVSVLVGSKNGIDDGITHIGAVLGRLASIPVMRKISRVRDGEIMPFANYFGSDIATLVNARTIAETLHGKGYITYRKYVGKSGFCATSDPSATSNSDDFNTIARFRTMNKAHRIAYATYVEYLDDEILINPQTGKVDAGTLKDLQAACKSQIDRQMTSRGEIVSCRVVVDPYQDVLATNLIEVDILIVPVGYASEISIRLQLENPSQTA
jgi:hypothetical protein